MGVRGQLDRNSTSEVTAAGTMTDERLIRGAGGKGLQDSGVTLDDSDNMTGVNSLTLTTDLAVSEGGTSASTLTGVLTGNGTSAFTASAVTDNTVVMGSTSNLLQDTTITVTDNGEMVNASQPAVLAVLGTEDSNVTGAGTAFTIGSGNALTEIFDQNSDFNTNGTFTSPVTGRYSACVNVTISGATSAITTYTIRIITSNRSYNVINCSGGSILNASGSFGLTTSAMCDMDASDTATVIIIASGEAGDTVDVVGTAGAIERTTLSFYLAC